MFTTGVSAISHHKFGNINKKLVRHPLIPGVLGINRSVFAVPIDGDDQAIYCFVHDWVGSDNY
jgi:uncharacterized membrane protein YfcA